MRQLIPARPPSPEYSSAEFFEWHDKLLELFDGIPGTAEYLKLPIRDPSGLWAALHVNDQLFRSQPLPLDDLKLLVTGLDKRYLSDKSSISIFELTLTLAPFWKRLSRCLELYLFHLSLLGAVPEHLRLPAHRGHICLDLSLQVMFQGCIDVEKLKAQLAGSLLAEQYKLLIEGLQYQDFFTLDEESPNDECYRISPTFTFRNRSMVFGPSPSIPLIQVRTTVFSFMLFYGIRLACEGPDNFQQRCKEKLFLEHDNLYSLLSTSMRCNEELASMRS